MKKVSKEQQYAHHELKNDEYQYLNEDKRLTTIDNKDKVIDNNFKAPSIKIKVINDNNTEQVLEDHRNNVYKLQIKPQMHACNNNETYELENNPREDEVNKNLADNMTFEKQLKEEHKKDMSLPNERYNPVKVKYKLNDKVRHKEENIIGKISFIGTKKLAVIWEDNTKERFNLNDLDELEYADDVQDQVEPMESENKIKSKPLQKSNTDLLFDKALSEMEDTYSDIETMDKKDISKDNNNFKTNDVNTVISLMKNKGLIKSIDEQNKYINKLSNMEYEEFCSFKNDIINRKSEIKTSQKTEAEKTLEAIRNGTFKKNNSGTLVEDIPDVSSSEPRDLKSVNMQKQAEHKLDLSGFKNLQGITKPIQVMDKQKSPMNSLKDALNNMDWSLNGK